MAHAQTGQREAVPRFAYEHYASQVAQYYMTASELSDRRWARMMTTYGSADPIEAFKTHEKKSSLSSNRQNLYIPSSP